MGIFVNTAGSTAYLRGCPPRGGILLALGVSTRLLALPLWN